MTQNEICTSLKNGLSELFRCSKVNDYTRITTPLLYPDGDNIDVFGKKRGDIIEVSDLGETTRWLRMQTVAPKRSPKQAALIADACLTHGVEFFKGALVARCRLDDDVSAVVTRVAQAALRVSDLWFTFRTRAVQSVTDEVADFLADNRFAFARDEKIAGRSGKVWTPNFHVRAVDHSSLVYVMSTGSKSAARAIVNQVHTAWYDLNHFATGPEALTFISLFDDTMDVWADEDFELMNDISTISRWSQPDQFLELLSAA